MIGFAVGVILLLGVTVWAQQSEDEQYCNAFTESITFTEAFDPDNPTASIPHGVELPEVTRRGCYETAAEALCAGSDGAICLPQDATEQDIDWAIRDYEYTVLGGHPDPGPWGWQPPGS